jgi:signal transduction histidine kinase
MESVRSVLVVDDDPVVLRIMADQIAREGYTVTSVLSVGEARQHLKRTTFGVVLADQTMPDTPGIEFLRECRTAQPLASRILATGNFVHSELDQALRHGEIWRLLIKPWTRSDLILAFQQAFERYELLQERKDLQTEVAALHCRVAALTRQSQTGSAPSSQQRGQGVEAELSSTNERLLQALDDLQHREQRIVQQAQLQALDKLAGSVAHDFNNALIPILGYIELLLDRNELLNDRQKARHYLQLVLAAARDATRVASRFWEFSRQREESATPQAVDLNQAVSDAVSVTQPRWRNEALARQKPIEMKVELRTVPPVACNEAELREVLTNLIYNATDALAEGGVIEIRSFLESAHSIVLEVQDNGIGMTPELRERCLEPFVTTKWESGSGLGLAMVTDILGRYGGSLEVESEPSVGSLFRVRLPAFAGPTEETVQKPAPGTLRILIVDDEKTSRDLLSLFLENDHHKVTVASNGLEALQYLGKGGYDLLVTDQDMPGMTGSALVHTVRDFGHSLAIIMVTGFSELMKSPGTTLDGVDLVINKPVTIEALRSALARLFPSDGKAVG